MRASSRNSFRQGLAREDDEQQSARKNSSEFARLIGQGETNLEDSEDKHTKQRAVDCAGAAEDRSAAQNDRGDGEQFVPRPRIGLGLPNPRDIDVFLVMQGGFQPRDAPPEAQILFRHDTAQNELGASILWVNAETSFADTEALIIGWQTRRDLQRRGIVEVVEHDAE